MSKSNLIYFPVTDSTNKQLRLLEGKIGEGFTAVAGRQTAGRGRLGRSFISPAGGLYMSVMLRPEKDNFSLITAAAAVAVTDVLSCLGFDCKIKWVNDILLDGKKVCGILAESVFLPDGSPKGVIVGIGINLIAPEGGFAEEIKDIAADLGLTLTTEQKLVLAEKIAERLVYLYPKPEKIVKIYKQRSGVLGKEITVYRSGVSYPATVLDIDESCGLVVQAEGKTEVLRTGEITIRIKQ